jgi:hypothetical protein
MVGPIDGERRVVSHLTEEKEMARGKKFPADDSSYRGKRERGVKTGPPIGDGKPTVVELVETWHNTHSPVPGWTLTLARSD